MSKLFHGLKRAASDFSEDDCMSSGAAMAYYSVFSLPPLLGLAFLVATYSGVERDKIEDVVKNQVGIEVPTEQSGGAGISDVAQRASTTKQGSWGVISQIISAALLVFGATGLFAQLQYSLNRAWEVQPDPSQGGIWTFVTKRVLSLGMVVVVLFLLLVSLVLTTVIDELVAYFQGGATDTLAQVLGVTLNTAATFVVVTLLFAAMFRVLPDAKMAWRDVWVGAAFTALLFVVGKTALGLYIKNADLGANWGGAAASLIGILIWVYYTSLIVLFGAELTQVWAKEYGQGIEPEPGAVQRPKASSTGGKMKPAH
jgi:membrane protein